MIQNGHRIGITAGGLLLLLISCPFIAYGVTTIGSGSICFSEGGWSSKADKIEGVKRFIAQYPWPNGNVRQRLLKGITSSSCCAIDKGQLEIPDIGLSALLLHGVTHYVHVPIPATVDYFEKQTTSAIMVDGCGRGLSAGIDL